MKELIKYKNLYIQVKLDVFQLNVSKIAEHSTACVKMYQSCKKSQCASKKYSSPVANSLWVDGDTRQWWFNIYM